MITEPIDDFDRVEDLLTELSDRIHELESQLEEVEKIAKAAWDYADEADSKANGLSYDMDCLFYNEYEPKTSRL